jgi:hypothetical protein
VASQTLLEEYKMKLFFIFAVLVFVNFNSNLALAVSASPVGLCTAGALPNASDCRHTPDQYTAKIYEMGLCTANPLSTNIFDTTVCTQTFLSTSGFEYDMVLAMSSPVTLTGTSTRPANGTYKYPYVVLSNAFTIKSKWVHQNGTTYYSKANNDAHTVEADYATFTDTLSTFAAGCDPEYIGATVTLGTINGYLTNSALTKASGGGPCSDAARLVGLMVLDTPLEIDNSVISLQFNFQVTDFGSQLTGDSSSPVIPDEFGSGPFSGTFVIKKSQ